MIRYIFLRSRLSYWQCGDSGIIQGLGLQRIASGISRELLSQESDDKWEDW